MNRRIQIALAWAAALLLGMSLAACSDDDKVGLSYAAYNHTDESIVSIVINGEGGVLDATAHGEGSGVCCVVLPKRWRPGLMATIKWQMDGHWLRDNKGNFVLKDHDKVFIEGTWKEKTVEVPKYSEEEISWGTFYMHFFPNNDVKVLVNKHWAGYEGHPYPHPDGTPAKTGK